ncbi:MAG: hypothetical protein AAF602_08265 [Myxococcota bacterium]
MPSARHRWLFDGVPDSGARLGGDPSAFVFDASVETFTREVLQNSADAGSQDVAVTFRLVDHRGDDADRIRDALGWTDLLSHVDSVRKSAGPTEAARFAAQDEADEDPLRILWIEDRNTHGLEGPESGGGSFAALCRDRLFSHKAGEGSGGSFGLGKAVLWRFSQWSTVVFHSAPREDQPRPSTDPAPPKTRFIAKAALPWHRIGDRAFAGDGWLGAVEPVAKGRRRAVSSWSPDADVIATAVGLEPYPKGVTGTRIGVLGFHDPAGDDDADIPSLVARIRRAAERNFWPAMALGKLSVEVQPSPRKTPSTPWRALYLDYREHREQPRLENEGDFVVVPIPLQLPGRKSGAAAFEAQADLVVRLSSADLPDVNELLAFRGAGMVVERRRRERMSSTARPFHALLVAGMARRHPGLPDTFVETFLRDAEPPSHDRWVTTPTLRQVWKRGYGKAVQRLWQLAEEELRRVVSVPVAHQGDGPDGLRRLFPLAGVGGGRAESAFRFRDLSAILDDEGWSFRGSVEPVVPTRAAWQVRIRATVPDEQGTTLPIVSLKSEVGEVRLSNGLGLVNAVAGQASVSFAGRTALDALVDPTRSSFELVITGGGARP